jgi:hypothetical protein
VGRAAALRPRRLLFSVYGGIPAAPLAALVPKAGVEPARAAKLTGF